MSDRDALLKALEPVLEVVRTVDPADPGAAAALAARLPIDGAVVAALRAIVRAGVEARWLCDRENAGVRYSRIAKSDGTSLSIDAVHMASPGPSHVHPRGEVDLAFAVAGAPRFDGRPEGWTVYPPGSWHAPTVDGGAMDILYFLPAGAIGFGPKPEGARGVGLQAE